MEHLMNQPRHCFTDDTFEIHSQPQRAIEPQPNIHAPVTIYCHALQSTAATAESPLDADEILPQLTTPSNIKAQTYSAAEWEEIRPKFTALYFSPGLKLREIAQKLSLEHGFHANEQMYKKRITKWGLKRNMKAETKDAAILRETRCSEFLEQQGFPMQPDKILRHARMQAKKGRLDQKYLHKVVKQIKARRDYSFKSCHDTAQFALTGTEGLSTARYYQVPSSMNLPDELADTELLFRALQRYSQALPSGSLCETAELGHKVAILLIEGQNAWRIHNFAQSRISYEAAGATLLDLLQRGSLPVFAVMQALHSNRYPADAIFKTYCVAALQEELPASHPFLLVAQLLLRLKPDGQRQEALFTYIIDSLALSVQTSSTWFYAAAVSFDILRRSGLHMCAVQHCKAAIRKLEEANLMRRTWMISLKLGLGQYLHCSLEVEEAKVNFEEALDVTVEDAIEPTLETAILHLWLGAIYANHNLDVEKARMHFWNAWRIEQRCSGPSHSMYLVVFTNLFSFLYHNGFTTESKQLLAENAHLYQQLEEATGGLWRSDWNKYAWKQ